ncbi:protein of unknown function [Magnetospirillum sp. XM-1]|nr:protein of unknown function [Magnetospirillum sp. XM-1]
MAMMPPPIPNRPPRNPRAPPSSSMGIRERSRDTVTGAAFADQERPMIILATDAINGVKFTILMRLEH